MKSWSISMTGCGTTRMIERGTIEAEGSVVEKVCRDALKPTSHNSQLDIQETVESSRANNRARDTYCDIGEPVK